MVSSARNQVFISYSREDKHWLDQLLQRLTPLTRTNPDAIWWDGLIKAGQVWEEQIRKSLESARVAVLLVSPGFLASEFILNEELPKILRRVREEGVVILWSLVRNCWYERTELRHYQAVPYQQTHTMRAWNTLSEGELDDLLLVLAREIDSRLREPAATPAPVLVEPLEAKERPAVPTPTDGTRSAEILLKGVKELQTVDEIGNLFILRERWADAERTYDRMIEIAAPYQERWMAWGYEKLGWIHRKQAKVKTAGECWKLAQILYCRTGRVEKADEMALRLQEISAFTPAQ